MRAIPTEYYGDESRWFIATVVDNAAPDGFEGRFKIRIHGLHSLSTVNIPEADLPWAQCVIPTTEGGVSGIGKMPQLMPNALVFGMFMDGKHSQTPLILGSIPHVEFPTQVQLGQAEEDVGVQTPENFFKKIVEAVKPKEVDIQNTNSGNINNLVKLARQQTAIRFFLNIGYTLKQAVGITACLSHASGMRTGENRQSSGLARYSRPRFTDLKRFASDFLTFNTQLAFIVFELRGTQKVANIRIIQSERLEGENGIPHIFSKYYIKESDSAFIKQSELEARRLMDRTI